MCNQVLSCALSSCWYSDNQIHAPQPANNQISSCSENSAPPFNVSLPESPWWMKNRDLTVPSSARGFLKIDKCHTLASFLSQRGKLILPVSLAVEFPLLLQECFPTLKGAPPLATGRRRRDVTWVRSQSKTPMTWLV